MQFKTGNIIISNTINLIVDIYKTLLTCLLLFTCLSVSRKKIWPQDAELGRPTANAGVGDDNGSRRGERSLGTTAPTITIQICKLCKEALSGPVGFILEGHNEQAHVI